MVDLNIVIVNYFSKDSTEKCVRSALSDLVGANFSYQITVVDNSKNQDGLRDALCHLGGQVKYVDALGNVGFGRGNNLGFGATLSRYHLVLNPDTVVPSGAGALSRLLKFMDDHPRVGAAGPKLFFPGGGEQVSCYRFDWRSILIKPFKHLNWDKKYRWIKKYADRLEMREFDRGQSRPVDWVLGAAMIVRHDAARSVGWFDERYFMYLEDCDLCQKLWQKGWPVYFVHDVAVEHAYERASSAVPGALSALIKNKLARIHLHSWIKYLWKWRREHKYYVKIS